MTQKNYKNNNKLDMTKVLSEGGKLPPQVIDFEEVVLGAIMLETEAFFRINTVLKPEKFYNPAHAKIYEAIQALSIEQSPIDMLTVTQQLTKMGVIDEVGGPFKLAQLTNKVASSAHIEHHSLIISQKFIQRELIRIGAEVQRNAYEEDIDPADMLDSAERELFNLSEDNARKESVTLGQAVNSAVKQIEIASKKPDGLSGLPSGFTDLDRMTAGWQASDLVIVAARPAMGKTAFVLSMARNIAVDHQRPVAVFSLEMSTEQLTKRIIASETEIGNEKLKNGRLEDWEWEQLEKRIQVLENSPMHIDDTPALSVMALRSKLRKMKMQHGIELAIIDYLQLMTSGSKAQSREQEVSTISRSIKAIAKELDIPIIALSQLNRSVEMRAGDKRPQLSDLRESGAIEQDADMVMFIHRPEYYGITEDEEGTSLTGIAELIIAKHRSGSVGDVRMKFVKHLTRFEDNNGLSIPEVPSTDVPEVIDHSEGLSNNIDFEPKTNVNF